MPIRTEPIRLQAPATNIVQDYEFADMGATDACIVWAAIAGNGSDAAHAKLSMGLWDTANVRSVNIVIEDGVAVATSSATSGISTTNIVEIQHDNDQTVDRTATISAAPGGNGIRLTWAGTESAEYSPWVIVTLINGVIGAVVGDVTPSEDVITPVTESGLGITPKVIFGMSTKMNFGDGPIIVGAALAAGWAIDNGTTIDNHCSTMYAADNDAASYARQRLMTPDDAEGDVGIATGMSGPAIRSSMEITNMDTGEFEVTTRYIDGQPESNASNSDLGYLALEFDGEAAFFDSQTPSTAVDWVPLTGEAFTPGSVIMLSQSHNNINNTRSAGSEILFYGMYSASENAEYGLCVSYEAGEATTSNASGRTESHFFSQLLPTTAPDFVAANPIFAAGSITFDKDDPLFSEGTNQTTAVGIVFESFHGRVYVNDAATKDGGEVLQTYPGTGNWADTLITMQDAIDTTGLTGQLYVGVENVGGGVAWRAITVGASGEVIYVPTGPIR